MLRIVTMPKHWHVFAATASVTQIADRNIYIF